MHHGTKRALLTLIALCLLSPDPATAQDPPSPGRSPSEGIALPDRSVAAQDDAASVEVNPAGLGFLDRAEAMYTFELAAPAFDRTVDDGQALFLAAGFGGLGFGFGAQWLFHPDVNRSASYRKFTFGAGIGDGRIVSLGANLNVFGSDVDPVLDQARSVDVGLQARLGENLALGLFARDLNTPFVAASDDLEDSRLVSVPRQLALSAVLRFWEGRIILDPEIQLVEDVDGLLFVPRVSIEPVRGIRLFSRAEIFGTSGANAGLSALQSLFAGLELSFGGAGALGAAVFTNDGDTDFTQHTYSIWVSPEKKRSVTRPIRRWHIIDLNDSFAELPGRSFFSPADKDFVQLLLDLDEMSRSASVKGVLLNISNPGMGYGQVWELRQRIKALEAADIEVVALLQSTSTKSVMIASACETVWMTPNVSYEPVGISSELLSYQGTLEKLGVDAEFVRVRDYKTAPEQYVRAEPSKESLEQTGAYLDTLYGALVDALVDGRDKPREDVVKMIDSVPLTPVAALEEGYVDAVVYPDEVEDKLRKEFKARAFTKGWRDRLTSERAWERKQKIAVIIASGAIVQGSGGSSPLSDSVVAGSGSLVNIINRVRTDPDVRGVVLRVDSPGGSALASDQIYRELRRLAQKKPVVTSMGNVAASGGYYIAAGAEEIYASPLTLTGSIGIFAGKFSLTKLGEMVGLSGTQLRRGAAAGPFALFAAWDDIQRAAVQRSMIYLYRLFLDQVAHTRPLSADEVDAVARGRVWTGVAAKERKLVDHNGGLIDAVRRAEQLAGMAPNSSQIEVANTSSSSALPGVTASLNALGGVRKGLDLEPARDDQLTQALDVAKRILSVVPEAALWPLMFEDGEALMLPPMIFEVR